MSNGPYSGGQFGAYDPTDIYNPSGWAGAMPGNQGSALGAQPGGNIVGLVSGNTYDRLVRRRAAEHGYDPDDAVRKLNEPAYRNAGQDEDTMVRNMKAAKVAKLTSDSPGMAKLAQMGMYPDLAREILKTGMDPNDTGQLKQALTWVTNEQGKNSKIAKEIVDWGTSPQAKAAGLATPTTNTSGAAASTNAGFSPTGTSANAGVSQAFISSLKADAQKFITPETLRFLGQAGMTPDSLLQAMQQATIGSNALMTLGALAAIPPQNQQAPGATTTGTGSSPVGFTPNLTGTGGLTDSSGNPLVGSLDALPPYIKFDDSNQASMGEARDPVKGEMSGGKSVTQALQLMHDMSPEQLKNLQAKLVNAGYYAEVMPGSSYQPDVWGDSTDPYTNAAWRQLLADSVTSGVPVDQLLVQKGLSFAPELAKLKEQKAADDRAKALQEAMYNQVTPDSADTIRSAIEKITSGNQMHRLSPQEQDAIVSWYQGVQSQAQLAQKHGSSYVPQPTQADIEQRIIATHPTEYIGAQVGTNIDTLSRLLKTPGGAI